MNNLTIGFTGHRPDKLPDKKTGYILPNPTYIYVCQEIKKKLLELQPEKIISGMALGSDQYAVNVAIKLQIPFIAAVPFDGQESAWPISSQNIYKKLMKQASSVEIISSGSYEAWKMQKRNQWIVDNSDVLIAIFDGSLGGTYNCVEYAKSKNKIIYQINPRALVK